MEKELRELIAKLGDALRAKGWTLATAESCTGGLIGGALTSVAGSSDWYLGGVISYANAVKMGLLGVPAADLAAHGAVSKQVVRAMAKGALAAVGAPKESGVSVAVSGVAGPGGGTPDKPVGMVWMAWNWPGGQRAEVRHFHGDRDQVRAGAVLAAVEGLLAVSEDRKADK